ncbi:uncharacterized protein LOC111024217 [Momordica charantia]|uniref:Uncharacterized protein LOC111024217 n=1 Tax=Momordica charantia TaxID=3673 RepID=A0A6J1DYI4_MOMCH|nr:uncharacterized protein LOC111024217 [Momordica charantia]
MASLKAVSRLSSRLHSLAPKLKKKFPSSEPSPLKSSCQSKPSAASTSRISCTSRLPLELSSQGSLMPLHSAIAAARLISSLTIESRGWGLVPQGISMPL